MSQDNNNTPKNNAKTTAPQGRQEWKIEMPLEGGGTISFSGDTCINALAAHKTMQAMVEATTCGCCHSHNTRLIQSQKSGTKGEFTQYIMICDSCKASYQFFERNGILMESANEQYRGWYNPRQANGDGQSNQQQSQSRSQQTRSQQQQGNSQPRNQQQQSNYQNHNQQQHNDYQEQGYYEDDQDIPF
jgi:hypothetical protein